MSVAREESKPDTLEPSILPDPSSDFRLVRLPTRAAVPCMVFSLVIQPSMLEMAALTGRPVRSPPTDFTASSVEVRMELEAVVPSCIFGVQEANSIAAQKKMERERDFILRIGLSNLTRLMPRCLGECSVNCVYRLQYC